MNKDSTAIDIAIQDLTRQAISRNGELLTETISPLQTPEPVLVLYGLFFLLLAVIICFLGWYYMKKKAETAKLMVQNNMSPSSLYVAENNGGRSISNFLKFGIILIALALALFLDAMLRSVFLHEYSGPVFILFMGIALVLIHILNTKKK
jgi:hypothetical protein